MNDPHVVSLRYRVEHKASIEYRNTDPLVHDEDAFRIEIAGHEARFIMNSHFAAEACAREVVESFIRKWEFEVDLTREPDIFRLEFLDSCIEDRQPSPISPGLLKLDIRETVQLGESVTMRPILHSFPSPPSWQIELTPDVKSMYDRYLGYCNNEEPLTSMAYFCLTVVERSRMVPEKKGRTVRLRAARRFCIHEEILNRIGKLTACKGGKQARKADGLSNDLSSQEISFLEKAVTILIQRYAEVAGNPGAAHVQIRLDAQDCIVFGY